MENQKEIIKKAFEEFKKSNNKNLKEMIRLQLLNNAYTYVVLSNNELKILQNKVK